MQPRVEVYLSDAAMDSHFKGQDVAELQRHVD